MNRDHHAAVVDGEGQVFTLSQPRLDMSNIRSGHEQGETLSPDKNDGRMMAMVRTMLQNLMRRFSATVLLYTRAESDRRCPLEVVDYNDVGYGTVFKVTQRRHMRHHGFWGEVIDDYPHVLKELAELSDFELIAPHDTDRSCTKLTPIHGGCACNLSSASS